VQESPIFTKTYDLLEWLIAVTLKFPKSQRFVMALDRSQAPYASAGFAIRRARGQYGSVKGLELRL
jgi:hypothetical protein